MAKYCSKCGSQLSDDANFCSSCGARQSGDLQSSPNEVHIYHHSDSSIVDEFFKSGGRINRQRYFLRTLVVITVCLLLGSIPFVGAVIAGIAGCWSHYCLETKRLHDLNKGNTLAIIRLIFSVVAIPILISVAFSSILNNEPSIPNIFDENDFLGMLFLAMVAGLPIYWMMSLYLLLTSGTVGTNKYGADPLALEQNKNIDGESMAVPSDANSNAKDTSNAGKIIIMLGCLVLAIYCFASRSPQPSPDEFAQSIGGLKLGDSVDRMHQLFGQEDQVENTFKSSTLKTYFYSGAFVWIDNNDRVVYICVSSNQFQTERGLSPGATLAQVIKEYGSMCATELRDGNTSYKYLYDSTLNPDKAAVMEFKMENDVVKSISLSSVGEWERNELLAKVKPIELNEPPESALPTFEPTHPTPPGIDRMKNNAETVQEAATVLKTFHRCITDHELSSAFNCLSSEFQNLMGYDDWVRGFDTTVSSSISDIKVESETADVVVLSYVLTAVDKINGRDQTAQFNGMATMIKEGGRWRIDEIINRVR